MAAHFDCCLGVSKLFFWVLWFLLCLVCYVGAYVTSVVFCGLGWIVLLLLDLWVFLRLTLLWSVPFVLGGLLFWFGCFLFGFCD